MPTNDSANGELNAKQAKALSALLREPTLEKAALSCAISESTLLRYLKDEAFITAYREARREVVSHAVTQLQGACGVAVQTLRSVAEDPEAPASSRVSAARAILDTSMKAIELEDLAVRVEALEELLQERKDCEAADSAPGHLNGGKVKR